MALPRRKVESGYRSSPYFWDHNTWSLTLSCGHVVTTQGRNGVMPKSAGCYYCAQDTQQQGEEK